MKRHFCEVIIGEFVFGPARCYKPARRRVRDENNFKRWICPQHHDLMRRAEERAS